MMIDEEMHIYDNCKLEYKYNYMKKIILATRYLK